MRTYHLIPADDWAASACSGSSASIRPGSLATEGFVHCTSGADEMVATANRHYLGDPRDFVILTLDLDLVGSPWRYDTLDTRYPHIYGEIPHAAIIGSTPIPRAGDGGFLPFEA